MPAQKPAPQISLIVNTYMKPRHLNLVLDSIERQEGVEGTFEVVISDDGSTDETATLVERRAATAPFRIGFTSRPHDGFRLARVRNDGARLALGKRLLFLDGDCMLPRNHVAVHLARCRQGVATGGDCGRLAESQSQTVDPTSLDPPAVRQLLPPSERTALNRRLRKWRWYSFIRHPSKPRLVGNNICIHRDDFERINGFDERFVGWGQEDDDISLRLRAAGVRLETVLDRTCSLHIWHPTDPTATARWRDGPNVHYFLRRGRLSCCRQGLIPRALHDLRWRLPEDLMLSSAGRSLAHLLNAGGGGGSPGLAGKRPIDASAEIDLVIRPGTGTFLRRRKMAGRMTPECRVLLIVGEAEVSGRLRAAADVVLTTAKPTPPGSADSPEDHEIDAMRAVIERIG